MKPKIQPNDSLLKDLPPIVLKEKYVTCEFFNHTTPVHECTNIINKTTRCGFSREDWEKCPIKGKATEREVLEPRK